MASIINSISSRSRVWVSLANLFLTLLVALVLVPGEWLEGIIRYGTMPVLAIALALFFWVLVRQIRRLPKQAFNKRFSKWILALIIAAAGFQLVHEDFGYKILMDEYNLTASSLNMHLDKSAFTPTRGKIVQGEFEVIDGYIDKRPFLYPFLLSIVHDISGYRITNPFLLNPVLNLVLFLVIYLAGFHLGGKRGGVLSIVLLAGLPLLGQNATGAGFELLNFLLLSLTVFLSLSLTARPGLDKETLLILSAILLAHVRYESILFLAPVVLLVGLRWKANPRLGPGWITVWTPWLLLPLFLQNRWFRSQEKLWELPGEISQPFSVSYISENVGHAVMYFFNWSAEFPNSIFLTVAGFVSLFFLTVVSAKRFENWKRWRPRDYDVLGLWGLILVGHMLVILAYHAGKLDSHYATRLGFPIHLILILSPVWLLVKEKMSDRYWTIAIAGSLVFLITFSAPHSSKAIFTKKNFVEREFRWAKEQLATQPDSQFLVIDSKLSHWLSLRCQAMRFDQARLWNEEIVESLSNGNYHDVFVLQRITIAPVLEKTNVWEADELTDFNLEAVSEYISKPFQGVRLSRLKM
jgi:hypothetical protein